MTTWTDFNPTSTIEYTDFEPGGYGNWPYGDSVTGVGKGYGDPTTQYTDVSIPTTVWTDV